MIVIIFVIDCMCMCVVVALAVVYVRGCCIGSTCAVVACLSACECCYPCLLVCIGIMLLFLFSLLND